MNTIPTDLNDYIDTDDAIFHYTKASTALENILFNKQFKPSIFRDTNDPEEYGFKMFGAVGWSLPEHFFELLQKAHPFVDKIIRFQFRVMCFCSNLQPSILLDTNKTVIDKYADRLGWAKARMWSQYGENHFGICLVFSRRLLEEYIDSVMSNKMYFNCRFVQYSQKKRNLMSIEGNRLLDMGIEKYAMQFVLTNIIDLFFIKYIDYRDESEYRAVIYDPGGDMEYIPIIDYVKGVVVGDRTPKVYYPLIQFLCKRLNIECKQIYWERGVPHLAQLESSSI